MPELFNQPQTHPTTSNPLPTHYSLPATPYPSPTSPMSLLSSFAQYPEGVSFAEKGDNEQIILFLRRHFITNIPWISGTIILILLPFLLLIILQALNLASLVLPTHFLPIILTFYYLIVIGYTFANFINWFYNIGLVTNKRIMDIDFASLSSIDVAATAVQDIQDVHYTQKGFAQQFYNYGDIFLQTDAKTQNFIFEKAPKPAQASNIISELIGGK